jgi:deoxycytidylate deaminase
LISIFAPLSYRKLRGNYNDLRDIRDRGKDLDNRTEFFKQNVSACVYLSDIAINNNDNRIKFQRKLAKHYALISRPGCISPTDDELFMQQAYSMSVKSNCISRQVGAIIVGSLGRRKYIIGAGWNDVGSGQISCGYRRYADVTIAETPFPIALNDEQISFSEHLVEAGKNFEHHKYCFKDEYSKFKTISKITKLMSPFKSLDNWITLHKISDDAVASLSKLISSDFSPKRLEYCRALHAEENAILQSSIIGGVGIEGATIYSTTFPCELCAKKIYQSRIRKVVYTEPYPDSISEDVFFKDGSNYIELEQFEGVKSHSFYRLFKSQVDKKEFQIQERLY